MPGVGLGATAPDKAPRHSCDVMCDVSWGLRHGGLAVAKEITQILLLFLVPFVRVLGPKSMGTGVRRA